MVIVGFGDDRVNSILVSLTYPHSSLVSVGF